jgi:hypothetical protein
MEGVANRHRGPGDVEKCRMVEAPAIGGARTTLTFRMLTNKELGFTQIETTAILRSFYLWVAATHPRGALTTTNSASGCCRHRQQPPHRGNPR